MYTTFISGLLEVKYDKKDVLSSEAKKSISPLLQHEQIAKELSYKKSHLLTLMRIYVTNSFTIF